MNNIEFVVREWPMTGGSPQIEVRYESVEEAMAHLDGVNGGATSFARMSVEGLETFINGFVRLPLKRGDRDLEMWTSLVERVASEMALDMHLEAEVSWHGHAEIRFYKGPKITINYPSDVYGEAWEQTFPCLMVWVD